MEIFSNIFASVALGVVEGITEFLPISSTGHLILVNQFLTATESLGKGFMDMFNIVIQLGAILAVIVVFWRKVFPIGIINSGRNLTVRKLWWKIIISVIPALVIGGIFGSLIQDKFFNPFVVAGALILGGIAILIIERIPHRSSVQSIESMSYSTAFLIGLAQCIAIIPGVSRSASTIVGGLLCGSTRVVATEFSFLLAVPTIAAASAYSLIKYEGSINLSGWLYLSIGFVVSFAVALLVIRLFMGYVQKNNFDAFGYYRIILGLLVLAYFI